MIIVYPVHSIHRHDAFLWTRCVFSRHTHSINVIYWLAQIILTSVAHFESADAVTDAMAALSSAATHAPMPSALASKLRPPSAQKFN
jgi:hypothetical protein